MLQYKLDLKWSGQNKCYLQDTLQNTILPLKMDNFQPDSINLAVLTFKQYSQAKSEESAKAAKPYTIPADYKMLVDKYPKLLEINFQKK